MVDAVLDLSLKSTLKGTTGASRGNGLVESGARCKELTPPAPKHLTQPDSKQQVPVDHS
jgi:hypothetical protein